MTLSPYVEGLEAQSNLHVAPDERNVPLWSEKASVLTIRETRRLSDKHRPLGPRILTYATEVGVHTSPT